MASSRISILKANEAITFRTRDGRQPGNRRAAFQAAERPQSQRISTLSWVKRVARLPWPEPRKLSGESPRGVPTAELHLIARRRHDGIGLHFRGGPRRRQENPADRRQTESRSGRSRISR